MIYISTIYSNVYFLCKQALIFSVDYRKKKSKSESLGRKSHYSSSTIHLNNVQCQEYGNEFPDFYTAIPSYFLNLKPHSEDYRFNIMYISKCSIIKLSMIVSSKKIKMTYVWGTTKTHHGVNRNRKGFLSFPPNCINLNSGSEILQSHHVAVLPGCSAEV